MFACLFAPRSPDAALTEALVHVARDYSPRVEVQAPHLVMCDVSGLERLLGTPRTIGEEIQRSLAASGLRAHIALSISRSTAALLACANPGLTVIAPGEEAGTLAPLPLGVLERTAGILGPPSPDSLDVLVTLRRWGLRTLGDLARLPAASLFERLGETGLAWQRLAAGVDARPLVPTLPDERFEQAIELEWPLEGLEPLSFVLGRLFDPLCVRLERRDRGAAAIHVSLRLVTREWHRRSLQLPVPLRDPRVLRTLVLLDLESHPPPAGIDRVMVVIDPTPGRVLQFSLLRRARPSAEQVSTLLARLSALMGEGRVGAPRLIDTYRPGAFAMARFDAGNEEDAPPSHRGDSTVGEPLLALRRFRLPIPARVTVEQGRPVRLTTDRRGFGGGAVVMCAGPWRTSGDWWKTTTGSRLQATGFGRNAAPWDRDEWDVALADGSAYRISCARGQRRWMVDACID